MLSTPVIKAVREAFPTAYIAMMVRPYTKDIVSGNPFLNEVIVYDKDGPQKGFFGNLKFASGLRKTKFDLAIILHPTNRAHLISWAARIPVRLGYDRKLGFLLTKKVFHKKQLGLMHEAEYNLELLKEIGIEAKDKTLFMPVKPEDEKWADGFLRENKISKDNPLVCVHPAASCVSKRWPVEKFARLIDGLTEKLEAQVVVFTAESDAKIIEEISRLSRYKKFFILKGVGLPKIAALLKKSRLLISNDSGPVHVSVAVGTPVIAIFGRKQPGLSPKRWGPLGKKDVVLHKDSGCAVCLAHNCQSNFKCLEMIEVKDVLNAAGKIL